MRDICIIHDSLDEARRIARQIASGYFKVELVPVDRVRDAQAPGQFVLVSIDLRDLNDPTQAADLKDWLAGTPKTSKVIFITKKASRLEAARAYALGATDLLHHPVSRNEILAKMYGGLDVLSGDPSDLPTDEYQGIAAAFAALQNAFTSACLGERLDRTVINTAGEEIVRNVGQEGLTSWIETVRKHHSQTYQHSLLVTGLVVGFGRQLRLSQADLKRLAFAGLLHDIGKSKVPVAILEKRGPLNNDEAQIMKQHPLFALDALEGVPGLDVAMVDAAVHHHELLDGSGYPHGIKGSQISDLVRILTISDIFAALIERRSYKPPLSGASAYKVLLDMDSKLDKDLVREFRHIAQHDTINA